MAQVLSDPDLHTFIGGTPAAPRALRSRYERLATGSPDPSVTWHNWVIRLGDPAGAAGTATGDRSDSGRPVLTGTVQATVTRGAETVGSVAEIAWVVGAPWQGRGIATEAARGLVTWLTETQDVGRVIAHIHPDHHASAAVATAAGLAPTDRLQDGEIRWERSPA